MKPIHLHRVLTKMSEFVKSLFALALLGVAQSAIAAEASLPRPDHIVIVVEENRGYSKIIANPDAPYINALAQRGVLFTQSYGVTHPSQPNYLALLSGTTRGISSNACPLELKGENLGGALIEKGLSFVSYSESLPEAGYEGCRYGAYMRKHNPAANWKELAAFNQPFTAFPQDYSQLPTVSFVVPDQRNDMHDGSIEQGDAWLAQNIERYAQWAMTHNSLLIVTFDEDDGREGNRIATMFVGEMMKPGRSAQRINHYTLLRTLSEMYGLAVLGESKDQQSITGVWKKAGKKR
ncbi:MAG: phosphoesterase [Gallionellaceae bacterium]|nr:MAG: phosphoesterase [Gallionellaceae bacterium]